MPLTNSPPFDTRRRLHPGHQGLLKTPQPIPCPRPGKMAGPVRRVCDKSGQGKHGLVFLGDSIPGPLGAGTAAPMSGAREIIEPLPEANVGISWRVAPRMCCGAHSTVKSGFHFQGPLC